MASVRAKFIKKIISEKVNFNKILKDNPELDFSKIAGADLIGPRKIKVPAGYTERVEKLADEVFLEIIEPKEDKNDKVIYYLHGGGYVIGLGDMYRRLDKKLSRAGGGATVVFLDYRVAHKHKYPAALEDAMLGWNYLLEAGYKPSNIMVMGDSAGGNLTTALTLKLIELNMEVPKALILFSPWLDMGADGKSYIENFNNDIMFGEKVEEITEELIAEKKEILLSSAIFSYFREADTKDPYVSPVYAEYKGFPPTLVFVGTHEILLSDSLTIVDKLKKEGVDVELFMGDEMFHVWPIFTGLFPEATNAMKKACDYIAKQLVEKP